MDKKNNRIVELDALRGLAAIIIMFYHYTFRYQKLFHDSIAYPDWFEAFRYAFDFFFILSGFSILITLNNKTKVLEFARKRFFRLYPTYWLCTIITAVVVYLIGPADRAVSWRQFFVNLTMLQYGLHIKAVDSVSWALFVEVLFYLHICLVMVLGLFRRLRLLCAIYLLGAGLNLLFPQKILAYVLDYRYGMFFIAGMEYCNLWFNRSYRLRSHLIIIACYVLTIPRSDIWSIIANTFIFAVFYLLIYHKLRFVNQRFLVLCGSISYPLFLLHQNIGYGVISRLERGGMPQGIAVAVAMVLIFAAAYLIHRVFEDKLVKKAQAFFVFKEDHTK